MTFAECLDQGGYGSVILCGREGCGDLDELVGNTALGRYDNGEFISCFVVFLKDIDNTLDTLGIGNGCPTEFHQESHSFAHFWPSSLPDGPFIYVTIRSTK
jgi:hypothetical protein